MKNKKLINWLCLSGVISIIFYLLHDIIGAMNYSGYNWMSQAVSDLTSTDAPSFVVASGFVTVYKILNCLCCALLCILIKNEDKKIDYTMHNIEGKEYLQYEWLDLDKIEEYNILPG